MHPLATTPIIQPGDTARGTGMRLLDAVEAGASLTNCRLLVDLGDINSMADTVANTALLDLSPAANDLIAGLAAGADSKDPAVVGTAGALDTTHSVHDGVQDSVETDIYSFATTPAWLQNLHKDSANWSFGALVYIDDATAGKFEMGNCVGDTEVGTRLSLSNTVLVLSIEKGASPDSLMETSAIAGISLQAWHFVGFSVDEAAASGFWYVDDAVDAFTSTYLTPSAGNASNLFSLGWTDFQHGVTSALSENARLGGCFFFEGRSLTEGEFRSIFERIRHRYGI